MEDFEVRRNNFERYRSLLSKIRALTEMINDIFLEVRHGTSRSMSGDKMPHATQEEEIDVELREKTVK